MRNLVSLKLISMALSLCKRAEQSSFLMTKQESTQMFPRSWLWLTFEGRKKSAFSEKEKKGVVMF